MDSAFSNYNTGLNWAFLLVDMVHQHESSSGYSVRLLPSLFRTLNADLFQCCCPHIHLTRPHRMLAVRVRFVSTLSDFPLFLKHKLLTFLHHDHTPLVCTPYYLIKSIQSDMNVNAKRYEVVYSSAPTSAPDWPCHPQTWARGLKLETSLNLAHT